MQAGLARIDAVTTVARESALAAARRATRALGRKRTALPPAHGVPVSIKDLTAAKGIRTTWGSADSRGSGASEGCSGIRRAEWLRLPDPGVGSRKRSKVTARCTEKRESGCWNLLKNARKVFGDQRVAEQLAVQRRRV